MGGGDVAVVCAGQCVDIGELVVRDFLCTCIQFAWVAVDRGQDALIGIEISGRDSAAVRECDEVDQLLFGAGGVVRPSHP
ncbi:hypothetical protein CRH09_27010 [Nocardia terpenica]|uniref:Uncharacterized protein n=1 Tax=Nocardia terpenica TaxID=455432 RepID=A0A291RNV3_9NOCA|nr:hypothetical protein CRH09_27010 [Nocardia terpenica]